MIPTRSRYTISLLAGLFLAVNLTAATAVAEIMKPGDFPKRPITILCPFSVGGGGGTLSRALAPLMGDVMGTKVRVVNKTGAGGVAGTTEFMTIPADGYTILQQTDSLLTAITGGRIDLQMGKDVVPLCLVQRAYSQIYIRSDEKRFTDWKSLVEYGKTHKMTLANDSGVGSMEHVASVALTQAAFKDVEQVNTNKLSERVSSLIGGHVDMLFEQPGDTNRFIKAGQIKPVLTLLKKRADDYPDTPSLTDVGLNDVEPLVRVRGLFVRSGVPAERRKYLSEVCKQVYGTEEFQKFNQSKSIPKGSFYSADETTDLFNKMGKTYGYWYKKLGVTK